MLLSYSDAAETTTTDRTTTAAETTTTVPETTRGVSIFCDGRIVHCEASFN